MRKNEILKQLPNYRDYKKALKADEKALVTLSNSVEKTRRIVDALEGVEVFNDHPVRLIDKDGDAFSVLSAAEEVGRQADARLTDAGWAVDGHYNTDAPSTALGLFEKRSKAERAAKAFVAKGRNTAKNKPQAE